MPIRDWGMILDNLMVYFGDRVNITTRPIKTTLATEQVTASLVFIQFVHQYRHLWTCALPEKIDSKKLQKTE